MTTTKIMDPVLERRLHLLYLAAKKEYKKFNIQYASRHITAAAIYCEKAGAEVPKRFVELAVKIVQADYEASVLMSTKLT